MSQTKKMAAVMEIVLDAIDGEVPGGLIYAALMNHMNLEQYNALIGALELTGAVVKRGHCLTRGPNYQSVLTNLRKVRDGV